MENCIKRYYNPPHDSLYNRVIKRCIDFILAVILLLVLLPLFIIIAVAIIIDSGFPVFYTPLRGGYRNIPFRIFKFRTMIKNADKLGGGTTALNDSRITFVGAFLRKTKLDEIPQLLNIIAGDMSFIGPRPELLQYTEAYIGDEKIILMVRPGITDYSSVEFINLDEVIGHENADEMYETHVLPKKNRLRVKYVKDISFFIDIKIFFLTVWMTLNKIMHHIFRRG